MVFQPQVSQITVEAFLEFALQPENNERTFELMSGEILEKMPGTTRNSAIAVNIGFNTRQHCREKSIVCYISTGDGAYRVGQDVVAPDMAYKQSPMSDMYPDPIAPLWVVEVISPTDKAADIRKKRQIYIDAGILLWEVYPDLLSVDVYSPERPPATFTIGERITVGDLIPDFQLAVTDIFDN